MNKCSKLIFLAILFLLFYNEYKASNVVVLGHANKSVRLVRDTSNNTAKIYLLKSSKIIDSISIYKVDFRFDSLAYDGFEWHYIYKSIDDYPEYFVKGKLKGFYRQVLLSSINQKIKISFVCFYHYSYPNRNEESIGVFRKKDYRIYRDKDSKNRYVKMFQIYKNTTKDSTFVDTTATVNYINYDEKKGIYYSYKQTLNGEFNIGSSNKFKTRVTLNNYKTWILEIAKLVYIYYEDNWYRAIDNKPTFLKKFNSDKL